MVALVCIRLLNLCNRRVKESGRLVIVNNRQQRRVPCVEEPRGWPI